MQKRPSYEELNRQLAEERARTEKYRAVVENIEDGYFEVDLAGNFVRFNDAMCRILGYSKEELPGMNNRAYMDEENAKKVFRAFNSVFETGESHKAFDWQLIRKDGSRCHVETSVALLRGQGGRPIGFHGIARDVTERKSAEAALVESEEKFRLLAENAEDVIFTLDMNLCYTYVSPSVKKFRGFEPNEVIGQTIEETLSERSMRKVSRIFSEELALTEKDPAGSRPARVFNLQMKRKDGTLLWAEVKVSFLLDENGKPIGILGVSRDITRRRQAEEALKRSEKKYRLLAENAADVIWSTDKDLRFTYVSPAVERIFGYPPQEVLGRGLFSSLLAADQERLRHVVSELPAGTAENGVAEVPAPLELRQLKKDGSVFWTEVLYAPLFGADGTFKGVQGTTRDIDARKRAEEKVRQLQKTESLGRMAGAVAHHFNNMISVISGNLELAEEELPDGSAVRDNVSEARQAARRASEMSRLMVTYLGQQPYSMTPLDLAETVRSLLPPLYSALPENVHLEADLSRPGPVVESGRTHIAEMLEALVTNAREAVEQHRSGKIRISVGLIRASDIPDRHRFPPDWNHAAEKFACLVVADDGTGIDPESIGRIFDPFYSDKFVGRGMGLATVLGHGRAHDGCITVESSPGKGSTFRVFFPLSSATGANGGKT